MELIKQILSGYLMLASAVSGVIDIKSDFPLDTTVGIWVWESPTNFSVSEVDELSSFLASEKINTIYLDINKYVDIYESENSSKNIEEFSSSLQDFVRIANSQGISVEGLAGSRNWGNNSHRYLNLLIVDFVKKYNDSVDSNERLAGIQFDIEPYAQTDFDLNKNEYLIDYLETIRKITNRISTGNNTDLKLGFAVPYWFDGKNKNFARVSWQGNSKSVIDHLTDIVSEYGNSYIAIMSYRKNPYGDNGSIEISKNQLSIASLKGVDVLIGQETGNVEPKSITFYGSSKNSLKRASNDIYKAFSNNLNFKGVILHDLDGFYDLK